MLPHACLAAFSSFEVCLPLEFPPGQLHISLHASRNSLRFLGGFLWLVLTDFAFRSELVCVDLERVGQRDINVDLEDICQACLYTLPGMVLGLCDSVWRLGTEIWKDLVLKEEASRKETLS